MTGREGDNDLQLAADRLHVAAEGGHLHVLAPLEAAHVALAHLGGLSDIDLGLAGGLSQQREGDAPVLEEATTEDLALGEVDLGDVSELIRGWVSVIMFWRSSCALLPASLGVR